MTLSAGNMTSDLVSLV